MNAILKALHQIIALLSAWHPKEVMNHAEAADYLRVSGKFLYDLKGSYRIPFIQVGGKIIYRKSALDKWLEAREIVTPKQQLELVDERRKA